MIFIVVLLALLWLLLVRPQRRRQLAQERLWQELAVGDEVVTAGGMYGTITDFAGEDVMLEIAPELEVRVARRAISGKIAAEEEEPEPAPAETSDGDSPG